MTGEETLVMFSRLRGIPEVHISEVIKQLADMLGFTQYINVPCGTYRFKLFNLNDHYQKVRIYIHSK